jgi:molybdenum cofactor synthesis domain-containing protein
MISVDRALEIVLEHTPTLPTEEVPLAEARGRVLGEEVAADRDFPPFDRSAMDGFALRARDAANPPATLRVVGQVRAGQWPEHPVGAEEAVEIMTGAPVPPGADAVQQVEQTRRPDPGRVEILAAVEPGQNVAPRGSEVRAGERVLEGGERIDPAVVAVLAAVGKERVRVGSRPRVFVLATGDELVDAGEKPTGAQIRNSNGFAALAQACEAGATARSLGIVPDDRERIAARVREGLAGDVLVLSGGVSVGVYDLVEEALLRFGVKILFDKVAIKPGAPLVFGRLDHAGAPSEGARGGTTLVFGLPGNPVSAQVTFDLFVRAALLRMQGARTVARPEVEVELGGRAKNRSGRRAHLPARVRFTEGRLLAELLPSRGSADLVAHARANALVVLEASRTEAGPGERAPALLLSSFLERGHGR